jgi:aspartyl-tRNA(Asn)/glutamyl-tRNA(Gln) amidotransferase subunit A
MGRCVSDVAALYAAVAGYDAQDPVSQRKPHPYPLGGLAGSVYGWRVALVQDEFHTPADREVMSAVKNAALVFESLGARVEQVDFSIARQAARANRLIVESEAAVYHRQRLAENPEGFGADVRQRLLSGAATSLVDYGLARRQQDELRREFEHFFKDYDFLLTPATPVVAPLQEGRDAVEQSRLLTRFTAAFNLTGLPALVLPCGFNSQRLPIGLQIVARPWDEARLLRAAFAYEQAAGWHTRRPAL